jgi:hypothetical protein
MSRNFRTRKELNVIEAFNKRVKELQKQAVAENKPMKKLAKRKSAWK